jgi:hypothetical protein
MPDWELSERLLPRKLSGIPWRAICLQADSNVKREIIPARLSLYIQTRQESWLISLPEELQSNELLWAITSGEVNCLSDSREAYDSSCDHSKWSTSRNSNKAPIFLGQRAFPAMIPGRKVDQLPSFTASGSLRRVSLGLGWIVYNCGQWAR